MMNNLSVKCLLLIQAYLIFHGKVLEAKEVNENFLDSPQPGLFDPAEEVKTTFSLCLQFF